MASSEPGPLLPKEVQKVSEESRKAEFAQALNDLQENQKELESAVMELRLLILGLGMAIIRTSNSPDVDDTPARSRSPRS